GLVPGGLCGREGCLGGDVAGRGLGWVSLHVALPIGGRAGDGLVVAVVGQVAGGVEPALRVGGAQLGDRDRRTHIRARDDRVSLGLGGAAEAGRGERHQVLGGVAGRDGGGGGAVADRG